MVVEDRPIMLQYIVSQLDLAKTDPCSSHTISLRQPSFLSTFYVVFIVVFHGEVSKLRVSLIVVTVIFLLLLLLATAPWIYRVWSKYRGGMCYIIVYQQYYCSQTWNLFQNCLMSTVVVALCIHH